MKATEKTIIEAFDRERLKVYALRNSAVVAADRANKAANGGLKRPGKPERISDLKRTLRDIRDLLQSAIAVTEEA